MGRAAASVSAVKSRVVDLKRYMLTSSASFVERSKSVLCGCIDRCLGIEWYQEISKGILVENLGPRSVNVVSWREKERRKVVKGKFIREFEVRVVT